MSGDLKDEHHDWVAMVFGIDPRRYAAPKPTAKPSAIPPPGARPAAFSAPARSANAPVIASAPGGPPPAADSADPRAAIIARITDTLAELDAAIKKLEADGIPAAKLEARAAGLSKTFAALSKPGSTIKQLQAFQKTVSAALAEMKPDADRQAAAGAEGTDKVIADLQEAARKVIDALTPGDARDGLLKRWNALDAQIKDAAKITDAAKLAAARKANEQSAQKMIDDAAAADPKSAAAKAAVQDAYKKALTDKYGLTFGAHGKIPEGKNMNYDNVFKTFEKVPIGHAVHDSLKDLSYNPGLVSGGHGIGAFGGASIQLGDFDIDRKADYVNAKGETEHPNSYTITVLHELGHSVDARWKVMSNPSGKGYGGWEPRSVGSIIAQVVDDAVKHADKIGLAADAIHDGVSTLLTTHKFGAPKEGVDAAAWDRLKHHLAVWIEIMSAEYPYAVKQYPFGRGYIPHGNGTWMTYLASERQVTHVTNYQWSAPAEWFAELYAICWYDPDTSPPSGVAAAVRAFLPGGDGAGNPDVAAH